MKKQAKKQMESTTLTTKIEMPEQNRNIKVEIVADSPQFLPMYKTKGAAAADLVANIPENQNGERIVTLLPNHMETIDLGFSIALPEGWEAQIRPRSSLSQKGVQIAFGTIDDDYRGRLKTTVNNTGKEIIVIKHGDRIAQLSLQPVYRFQWEIVNELSNTERSDGGFGSTGV